MNRTVSEFAVLLGVFLLLAAWCASGWIAADPVPDRPFLSGMAAIALIVACAVLLYLTNDRFLTELSFFTPVAYIVLATADPAALWFTPFHGAALLLAISLSCLLCFCAVHPSIACLSGTWVSLGAASLIFPPFLWLFPVYAAAAAGKAEEKSKFWAASLLGVCLPPAIYAGIIVLLDDAGAATAFFSGFWERMTEVARTPLHFSAATLCRIALTALAVLLTLIRLLGRLNRYKIAHHAAISRIIFLTLAVCLLTAVFWPDRRTAGLVTALPVSLLLNEYFGVSDRRKGARTLAVILIFILIAERLTYFI